MIKHIIKDDFFLSQKSQDATIEDLSIATDLLDTLKAHLDQCVGMAANMIGVNKNIIIVLDGTDYLILFNPHIIKFFGSPYTVEEGCLSHQGTKTTTRYKSIKVEYLDAQFKKRIKTFSDHTAQIIQHEMDHCQGILI